MAPSFYSRVPDGREDEESTDSDEPLNNHHKRDHASTIQTTHHNANPGFDSVGGVGEPVEQDGNQATDKIDEEGENYQYGGQANVANGEEDGNNNHADEPKKDVKPIASKRGRPCNQSAPSPEERRGLLKGMQEEPNSEGKGLVIRKRGRPSKSDSGPTGGSISAGNVMTQSSPKKRQRVVAGEAPRRSSRAAAKLATKQITYQSTKQPKALPKPATPSTRGRKKKTPNLDPKSKQSPVKTSTKHEFEVEHILATRKNASVTEYLVKWKGYDLRENTWEPAANLTHCARALKQFRADTKSK